MSHAKPVRRFASRWCGVWSLTLSMAAVSVADLRAQSVCLPLPRLLTLVPAGDQKPGEGLSLIHI